MRRRTHRTVAMSALRRRSRFLRSLAALAALGLLALPLRLGFAATALAASSVPAPAVQAAMLQDGSGAIVSAGPLTRIQILPDLACAVDHAGDDQPEFYGDHACGTLVVVGGTLYRPADLPSGDNAQPFTAFTPVSQTPVQGTGTAADPYRIVTVVDLGTTGLRLTETDAYVVGQETYRTDVSVASSGGSAVDALVYRAGDCFLQNNDNGFGAVDPASGAVSCVSGVDDGNGGAKPGPRIQQWYPLTPGSAYYEAGFSDVWARIGAQQAFPNTCACTDFIDNGAGLSWPVKVPAGGAVTVSQLTGFSPLGVVPVALSATVDPANPSGGARATYTLALTNPNTAAATVLTISADLPAGFAYVPGSSGGLTTADPQASGQRLTWTGRFPLNPSQRATLTFATTAATTSGTYTLVVAGTADSPVTVAATGAPAVVTVGTAALADVLPGPQNISLAPQDLARSLGFTFFLMFFIAAPTPLFNNTLEENREEIRRMLRLDRLPKNTPLSALSRGWLGAAVYLVIAALLYAFLDPSFPGANGVAIFAAGFAGLAVANAALALPRDRYVWTRYRVHGAIAVAQWTLVLAAVCVLVTRLLGIQPGYIYGIIGTTVFAVTLTKDDEGAMAYRASLALLGVGLAAWFLRIPVQPSPGHPAEGLALVIDKVLVAVFVAGVEGLVFGLIPIRFMPGDPLRRWRAIRWIAVWTVAILLFAHVILYPVSDYEPNPSAVGLVTVTLAVLAYSAIAVGFWWYFRQRARTRLAVDALRATGDLMANAQGAGALAGPTASAPMAAPAAPTAGSVPVPGWPGTASTAQTGPMPAPPGAVAGPPPTPPTPSAPTASTAVPVPAAFQQGPPAASGWPQQVQPAPPTAPWAAPPAAASQGPQGPQWGTGTPPAPPPGPQWGAQPAYGPPTVSQWGAQQAPWTGAPPEGWPTQRPPGWSAPGGAPASAVTRPEPGDSVRLATGVLGILSLAWAILGSALVTTAATTSGTSGASPVVDPAMVPLAILVGVVAFGIGAGGFGIAIAAWRAHPSARGIGIAYALIVGVLCLLVGGTKLTGTPPVEVVAVGWVFGIGYLVVAAIYGLAWRRR